MRILVVDDSVVFRSHIKAVLEAESGLTVVGTASNGKLAIERLEQTKVDLVTLDLEMPVMNGLATLAEIKKRWPHIVVLIFASATASGSQQALQALRAGAADMIAKPTGTFQGAEAAAAAMKADLLPKIRQFQSRFTPTKLSVLPPPNPEIVPIAKDRVSLQNIHLESFRPRLIVIASSTGGPAALESMFSKIKTPLTVPILIAQHMPPLFTKQLVTRLAQISSSVGLEAVNGGRIESGKIYIAPGDFHLRIGRGVGGELMTLLDQLPQRNSVRPAADFLFESAAALVGASVLSFVMTGMGEDGKVGAIAIKNAGGAVVIQDEQTSVVWGMPGSVKEANAFDRIASLDDCGELLATVACRPLRHEKSA